MTWLLALVQRADEWLTFYVRRPAREHTPPAPPDDWACCLRCCTPDVCNNRGEHRDPCPHQGASA